MLKKVICLLKRYGVWYTAKKIICKFVKIIMVWNESMKSQRD